MESNSAPAVVWQFAKLNKGFRRNYGASLVREENPPNLLYTMWLYIDHSNDHVACVPSVPIRADREIWDDGKKVEEAGWRATPLRRRFCSRPTFRTAQIRKRFVRAARFRWLVRECYASYMIRLNALRGRAIVYVQKFHIIYTEGYDNGCPIDRELDTKRDVTF